MTDRPVRSGTRTRLFAGAALLVVIVIAAIIAVVLFTGEKDFVVEGGYQVIGDAVSKKILAGESSTLSHEDGARIEVPKGAITDSATLVIAEVEPPISTLAVPFAYDFSVAGADLLNPVTVYIPIEPGWANQPSNIHALHWSDEFEDWEPVAGKVDESLLTIAVTTDDLSLFTAVFVKVEATCNVDPTTAQTGRNGQSITFSSMVRAIETPLNSDINVYMRPSFIDYTRGTVSSEVVGDPFRTETRTLTEGGSSVTFSYSSKTDYSGSHDFKCRLFWEFPGDIPDNELEPDSVVAVAFDITGSGTYFGYEGLSYDGSRLKSCGPSSTPLLGESVPLKVIGHGVNRDKGFKTYFVAAVKIYEDSELIHLEFGKRPTDSFTNAIPIVDTTYTFPSDGHYTMDCELWWHAGDPHIPTGTLEEKAKSIGRCVFSSSFCVGGVKALRGVLTRTFDITSARWAAEGVRVSPSLLPNEGGEITVTVHSESSTGVQISAPTISIASLGFQLPANSCGTTDLGSYVSRCWQASFNGANKIPANNSSQGVSYQVTASSVSIPGGNQTTSVTVGAPPPPPIVQPPPPTDASDREALIALYDATRGEIWYNNSQGNEVWDVDEVNSDISSWHGVTVNSAGRVTGLDLYRNSLRYDRDHRNSLPPELGNLAYLWSLVLSDNDLRGRIPDAFGNLGNLVELLLDDNSLSGNIPASLGNLTSLESLDLSNNNLSGEIPPGLGSLPRMDVVYLGGNNLSGCVPAEWRRVQGDPDELGLPFCDVALNDLTVSPGRLSPEFEVSESSYTVEIPAYETTITPANYQGASFQFLDAGGNVLTDADAARPGHQVQLTAATTTVRILVTSRDGEEDASYTIEISRSPGAPGAPVINPATPGPATLALSWSAPSNTGTSPISSYSLRYRVAGPGGGGASAPWMVVQSIWNPSLGGLSYDLTGLQPSVRYELQMRAVNNSGPGPWSATVTGATVSALPPGMPLNSMAVPAGQTGIRLSWGRPSSDGGSPITGYRIQASEDGSTWATLVANARPGTGILTYSHTALTAGSTWHYRVAAINSAGLGTWSNVATASTASPGTPQVPGPPVNPAATAEGATSIRLTWGPPASSGGGTVSGYQLEVSVDGVRWSPLVAVGPLTTSYTHTGLPPQSARRYRVAAANAAGLGEWSVVFSATTNPDPVPAGPGSVAGDRIALVALYNSTGGRNWAHQNNWLSQAPLGQWDGIHTYEGRVTFIDLGANSLSGSLPSELGNLSKLQELLLYRNQLTGAIPASLASLPNLEALSLPQNNYSGTIPAELGSLSSLRHLDLSTNQFTGAIPKELGNLSNLETLALEGTGVTGVIPEELGNLSNLNILYLSHNELTGTIPSELGGLSNLTLLNLSFNRLTGTIPSELGSLTNLEVLALGGNDLRGELPSELRHLTNLRQLVLWRNEFSGPIPRWLGTFTELNILELWSNNFSGPVPLEIGNLRLLSKLQLANNRLSGEIPPALGNLTNLEFVTMSENQLTGCIPSSWRYIRENDFRALGLPPCGEEPVPTEPPKPEGTPTERPKPERTPSAGSVEGDRAALVAFYHATDGPNWINNDNWLSDTPLGEWYGVRTRQDGRVITLYSGMNQLSGEIPAELGNLSVLWQLWLQENSLSGTIPRELGNLSGLTSLNLGRNQLSGEIPEELGNLGSLIEMNIYDNRLSGEIPEQLGNLGSLWSLYLGHNELNGEIPKELGNLGCLEVLDLAVGLLSGQIPEEFGSLANLAVLNLAVNQLSGQIPKALVNLDRLTDLHLGGNQFGECIPEGLKEVARNDLGFLGLPYCN